MALKVLKLDGLLLFGLVEAKGRFASRHEATPPIPADTSPAVSPAGLFDVSHLACRFVPSLEPRLLSRPTALLGPVTAVALPVPPHVDAVRPGSAATPVARPDVTLLAAIVCPPVAIA